MAVLYDTVQVVRNPRYVHATLRLSRGNWYQLRVYTEQPGYAAGQREWCMACPLQVIGGLAIMGGMHPCTDIGVIPEDIRDQLTAEMMAARLAGQI